MTGLFRIGLGVSLLALANPHLSAAQTTAAGAGDPKVQIDESKPSRGFVSALFHNLGDDIKHTPRRNSVYVLAAGAIASFAAHPADHLVNRHLVGSPAADKFFAPRSEEHTSELQSRLHLVCRLL